MGTVCVDLDVHKLPAKPLRRRPTKIAGAEPSAYGLPSDLIYRRGAREILLRWPELRALIPEVFDKLRESFGSSAQIALDRFDEPEAEQDDPILYLIVVTQMKAPAARQALDRFFEDEWWLSNAERANDRLHVSVEFL